MPIIHDEDFLAWEACAPQALREDPIWRLHVYRVAMYLLDQAVSDLRSLRSRRNAASRADQLLRAVTSVSANVAEGFGRTRPADRSRFFNIALGSLRESVSWYQGLRRELPPGVVDFRIDQLGELRRLLIGSQRWLASKPERTHLV
jgi:four helix bundle protein